jgi:hyperosmotically inducible protein
MAIFPMKELFIFSITTFTSFSLIACGIGSGRDLGLQGKSAERTMGDTVDDQWIVTKIKSALLADPEVSGLDINVDSFKGIVTLQGFVKTNNEGERAIYLARRVNGVKDVRSKLVLQ